MKHIAYIMPVAWLRGSISGHQHLTYEDGDAYALPTGSTAAAQGYSPRVIAMHGNKMRRNVFQVRTRFTVTASDSYKRSLALLGGCGAIYAAIMRDKSSALFTDCVRAFNAGWVKGDTFRTYVFRKSRAALIDKAQLITMDDGVTVNNPWQSSGAVVVSPSVLDKFSPYLS